jgi:hypothetical protein
MKALIIKLIGFVVFAVAFVLPAANGAESGPGSGPYTGWTCALVAISASAGIPHLFAAGAPHDKEALGALCLILSGWINPLVLSYLLFSIWKRLVWIRRALVVATLACIGATWVFFAEAPMHPLIGHYVWIGGIVLILSPEAIAIFQGRLAKDKEETLEHFLFYCRPFSANLNQAFALAGVM